MSDFKDFTEYLAEEPLNKLIRCSNCNKFAKNREWLENDGHCPHCGHYGVSICDGFLCDIMPAPKDPQKKEEWLRKISKTQFNHCRSIHRKISHAGF